MEDTYKREPLINILNQVRDKLGTVLFQDFIAVLSDSTEEMLNFSMTAKKTEILNQIQNGNVDILSF